MTSISNETTMRCLEVWGGNDTVDSGVTLPGLDAWVYSKPHGGADSGGDVYYVSSCVTGRIVRLLVADVSGHGASVADVAVQLRALMRQHVSVYDQGKFVRRMNGQFARMAEGGCFATAVVTTFYAPTRRMSFCNAGHPPPLLFRAASGTWSFVERPERQQAVECDYEEADQSPANLPFGIIDLADYDQFELDLEVGDLVLCYTDSLPEARNARTGELLGQARLLQIARSLTVQSPDRVIPSLLAAIALETGVEIKDDDLTILLFRPNGTNGSHFPLLKLLRSPFVFARGVLGARRNAFCVPHGRAAAVAEAAVS